MTDALAWSGLTSLGPNLLAACGSGAQDLATREAMAYGSLMSGICLANAGLGIVHGLAGPLGGLFPIPHGVACGTLVAAAARANWQALRSREPGSPAVKKMARLGAFLSGVSGRSPSEAIESLVDILEAWTEALAIPRLGTYGIDTESIEALATEGRNRNNPIALTPAEIEALLRSRL